MQLEKNTNRFQQFERLENRVLFSVVSVADFGARVDDGKNDLSAIQTAIDSAKDGDTVQFDAGQYDLAGILKVPSNRKLLGSANHASKLVLTTANTAFAIQLIGGNNITIDGLSLKANDGVILAQGNTSNVKITNNDFVWGYDGTYYHRLAIRAMGRNNGMAIEGNYFHDSLTSDRTVDLFNMINSSYSYNKFYKVNDGGHIDGESNNFKFVYNVGTQIHRMGLELQDHFGASGANILIANNSFSDWYKPDGMSFGLSIMPQHAKNITIENNYLSTGSAVATRHYGYGIESGIGSGIVQNNTLIGPWVQAITCSMPQTALKNNKTFGSNPWGAWGGEPGLTGHGSVNNLGGNKIERDLRKAPAPPVMPAAPSDDDLVIDLPEGGAYLSDIKWAGTFNGWGAVEVDQSLGDRGTGDGGTMTLNGVKYEKGLGVGLGSSIVYALGGKYTTFNSDIGIDDAVGSKGSMTFEVWGDGKKLYDSGVMKGSSATKSAQVDITGVRQLRLITTSAGDTGSRDHGDWAAARVS